MNKKQLEDILIVLFKQKKEDELKQEITYKYFDIVYPDSYAPILDGGIALQLEVLKPILSEELIDWIEYFLYEADHFYPNCEIKDNGVKHIISSDTDAIIFILNHIFKDENKIGG